MVNTPWLSSFTVVTCVLGFTVLNNVTLTECYLRIFLLDIDSLSHFKSWQSSYFPKLSCWETRQKDREEYSLAIVKFKAWSVTLAISWQRPRAWPGVFKGGITLGHTEGTHQVVTWILWVVCLQKGLQGGGRSGAPQDPPGYALDDIIAYAGHVNIDIEK